MLNAETASNATSMRRRPPAVSTSPRPTTNTTAIDSSATAIARYTTMCGIRRPKATAEGRRARSR